MREEVVSSVRLRHIGRSLRELRERARMTLKAAERHLDRSASSLSRIEQGQQPLRPRDLKYILDVYDVAPGPHRALMTLAEQERQNGWWSEFKDVISAPDLDYASLEWDAARLDSVETQFIPGLLQTEEYAHAIMRSSLSGSLLGRTDDLLAFRMARQRILRRADPPRFHTVIDEAALRRPRGGPETMRAQLHRLLDVFDQDHITVQVLPFSCAADPGISETFSMLALGLPPILRVVLINTLTGRRTLDLDANLIRYREAFDRVRAVALPKQESRVLIHRIFSEP
ncbi:helix-turn-helix domain-containing protein [Actinomadura scrupuli]|uniref:helix-turn-helix domain-containing protein n=1 Tax=Actinomadura scrupuli TaxID=559629 RepID=UPI003D955B1C